MGTSAAKVTWVLPAFNEEAALPALLASIREVSEAQRWEWRVVVSDDGSTDSTPRIAEAQAAEGLPVILSRTDDNRGLGAGLRRGLRAALEPFGDSAVSAGDSADVVITLDADLTHDPHVAPALVTALEGGFDVAVASRFRRGSAEHGVPIHRRFLSRGVTLLIGMLRPIPGVRDYSTGFRAYRSSTLRSGFGSFGDELITENGFGCMLEVAQKLAPLARFVEVPYVLHYDRKPTPSKIRLLPTIRAYLRVLKKLPR